MSLEVAKRKRDEAKKDANSESNKVKLSRKRVERGSAKAHMLGSNDLYEVYLMRMQDDAKQKSKETATAKNVEASSSRGSVPAV